MHGGKLKRTHTNPHCWRYYSMQSTRSSHQIEMIMNLKHTRIERERIRSLFKVRLEACFIHSLVFFASFRLCNAIVTRILIEVFVQKFLNCITLEWELVRLFGVAIWQKENWEDMLFSIFFFHTLWEREQYFSLAICELQISSKKFEVICWNFSKPSPWCHRVYHWNRTITVPISFVGISRKWKSFGKMCTTHWRTSNRWLKKTDKARESKTPHQT